MKKVTIILFLFVINALTGFTTNSKPQKTTVYYAFVTDMEHDKSYDEPGNNGYVNLATNIVTINCAISENNIKYQYIDHYNAQEKTSTRERAFIGASGITSVWVYNTYDEALASRRDWLAKKGSERKRTIDHFYATCN